MVCFHHPQCLARALLEVAERDRLRDALLFEERLDELRVLRVAEDVFLCDAARVPVRLLDVLCDLALAVEPDRFRVLELDRLLAVFVRRPWPAS